MVVGPSVNLVQPRARLAAAVEAFGARRRVVGGEGFFRHRFAVPLPSRIGIGVADAGVEEAAFRGRVHQGAEHARRYPAIFVDVAVAELDLERFGRSMGPFAEPARPPAESLMAALARETRPING